MGLIFFTQGILKFTEPNMGVVRFTRIGVPWPGFAAHFGGTFEILCGLLIVQALATRLGAVPLLAVILAAIATTKLLELLRAGQGFGLTASDARAGFAMLCSLVFLPLTGPGPRSIDRRCRRDLHG